MRLNVLNRFSRNRRITGFAGQTLVEYCICGGTVLLACVVGITLFSGNLGSWFELLKQDMKRNAQVTAQATAEQQQSVSGSGTITEAQAEAALSAGEDPQAEGSDQVVSVSGANGGTVEAYVSDILGKAKQSLDAGNLTQDEYNVIMKMANKGHDIAAIQGLLEGAFNQSQGNSSAYANTSLSFNGQTYTPAQLNAILETNISDFSSLKAQASTQIGVLYDVNLLSTIDTSGAHIINNGFSSMQQNQTAASFIQYQNEGVAGGSASTHQESATVCTAGSYQDSGTQCSN